MSLNKMIDHTLLAANATREQIARLCDEAVEHGFASVCVNSCWPGGDRRQRLHRHRLPAGRYVYCRQGRRDRGCRL